MITKTQALLIREICNIQKESLERVFSEPNLGEEREEILSMFGATRADFDNAIISTMKSFDRVKANPELLYELPYSDLIVFIFILSRIKGQYMDKYPKAISNLGNKIITMMSIDEMVN